MIGELCFKIRKVLPKIKSEDATFLIALGIIAWAVVSIVRMLIPIIEAHFADCAFLALIALLFSPFIIIILKLD